MRGFAVIQEDYGKVGCGESFTKTSSKFLFILLAQRHARIQNDLSEGIQF